MADRRRKKTDIEEAKKAGQKALEDAKAGKIQRVESENEVRGFAEIPYLQGGNSHFGDTSPSVAIDTPELPTVQQMSELSRLLQEQNASRNEQRRAERDRMASLAQSQSESVPMSQSMGGYGPNITSGTLDRMGTLSENGQKEVDKLNKKIESLRKTPMTGDAAIDEVTQSNNQSAIADLQRQIDSIYETDNSERSANVDRYLDSDRKLSKYEKNEANAIFEEYLNNNPKAKELYNTNDAAMSSLLAQRFTPDEAEEYAKMITLKNKISRGQSAGLHATESMPFVKGLADKSTEKYGERIGRDLSDYDYSSQLEQTQTQNPLASTVGNMAYQLGSYAAFAPLLEGIPVVGKAAEKVGGLFSNPAVGEAAANIVRGQAADTILDTLPNEVLPDVMEGNWRDLPKDILLNQAGNLAFNLGGEAVGALANRVIPYLRNADEVADAVKQNEIDPSTLAKQNEIDVNAKVDNVNQAVDEINNLAEQIPETPEVAEAIQALESTNPNDVIYHAGILSRLNKSDTAGKMEGMRDTGYYGTGHYFVDSAHRNEIGRGTGYGNKPQTSVDISRYNNLFKADTDAKASDLHDLSQRMMRYINGYNNSKFMEDGEIVPELLDEYMGDMYSNYSKLFGDKAMSREAFEDWVNNARNNYHFDYNDRGDSAFTTFMKEHGYNGVDTRGTRSADTSRGVVIYDLDEDSILQSNVTDEATKNGLMNQRIRNNNPLFDEATDARIQKDIDSFEKQKAVEQEYYRIYDSAKLDNIESQLDSANERIKTLEEDAIPYYERILDDEDFLNDEVEDAFRAYEEVGLDDVVTREEIAERYRQDAINGLEEGRAELAELRMQAEELNSAYDAERQVSYDAYQQAQKNVDQSASGVPATTPPTTPPSGGGVVEQITDAISKDDFRPLTFTHDGDTFILSKSTRDGEKWQLSQVDDTGRFVGHSAYKNDDELLSTLNNVDNIDNLNLNGEMPTILDAPTVTIGEMLNNPDAYSFEDFERAMRTFDANADTSDATKDDIIDFFRSEIEGYPEAANTPIRMSDSITPPGVNTADEVAETLENTEKSVGENADEITNADVNAPNESPVDTPEITSGDVNSPDKNLSKVYTNTLARNQVVDMADEVDRMNAEYNVHHASDVLDAAKTRYLDNAEGWEKAYASGKEPIQSDVDVSTAIMLLKDKAAKIDDLIKQNADPAEIERLTNEKNLLALKLRMAGTEKGQAIKAFDYFNGTAEGAVINAQRMFDREAKKWAKRNPKQAKQLDELSEDLLKVFRQMNPKTGEPIVKEAPTHDQLLKQIENTLDLKIKDKGVRSSFTPEDIDYIANMIENNASIKELTAMMQTRIANGTWDIPSDVVNKVNNIFAEARNYNPNSKKRVDLETEAFWELANSSNTRASLADKFEAWRYLAMLGNPKTHVRNMIGNVLFSGVTRASDSLAAVIEGAADKTSKAFRHGKGIDRTKAILTPKDADLLKATKQDALDNAYRQLSGSKWNDSKGVQRAINDQREVFSSKLIRKYNDLNNRALSGEDTMAMKSKYQTSLAGYLKAHGIDQKIFDDEKLYYDLLDKQKNELLSADETTLLDFLKDRVEGLNKAREYAIGRAEYAAFHEDNAVADFLSEMSRKARTSEHGSVRAMGMMGEGILPFKKTPANILRSGFEYSPLNIIQDVVRANNIRKGTGSAAELIESMSKTLTGSLMVGMGAWMYDKGILNMSDEDTKWQDNLEGRQNYSISFPVGNDTYTATIDFAAPSVMPIFLGAQVKKMWDANLENKPESFWEYLSEGLQAGSKLISPIAETSMLSGISDTLDSLSSDNKLDALANLGLNTTLGYFSQGIPTVLGQIARTIDDTRRSTYSEQNNALARSLDKKAEKIQNKIPFLSMLNQPYVDAYGRTQENSPFETGNNVIDFLGNAAYQGFSPSYIQKVEPEDADTSAWEAYNNADSPNKNVFAGLNTSKKIGDKRLSEEDYTTYATVRGETNLALRNALANNEEFNALSPNVQSEVLAAADNFADDVGEMAVNPEMELTNTWHKVYENTEGTEADKINAVVEDILAEHNKYGIEKDAYKSLLDAGEDMSIYEGYGDSLAELGLNDNAGNRDAWKQGGAEGLQAIADYNNAFTDAGMDTVYTSQSAVQAYESGDLDTYKEYRAYIKKNDIRDSEKQWNDFKRNSGKTNEITTLDPAYQPQGQRDANGNLIPIYNENSNSDVLSQIKSSSIKVSSPDAAYAKASAVFPGLTATDFLQTWSSIDADGNGKHKKDEWTSYLNSMGYNEDEAAALLRAYYPNNYKPLKYSNGTWRK